MPANPGRAGCKHACQPRTSRLQICLPIPERPRRSLVDHWLRYATEQADAQWGRHKMLQHLLTTLCHCHRNRIPSGLPGGGGGAAAAPTLSIGGGEGATAPAPSTGSAESGSEPRPEPSSAFARLLGARGVGAALAATPIGTPAGPAATATAAASNAASGSELLAFANSTRLSGERLCVTAAKKLLSCNLTWLNSTIAPKWSQFWSSAHSVVIRTHVGNITWERMQKTKCNTTSRARSVACACACANMHDNLRQPNAGVLRNAASID